MLAKNEALAQHYAVLAARVVKNLEARQFAAYYCENREAAAAKALSLMTAGSSVAWGGSVTVEETGLIGLVYAGGFTVIDRDKAATPEERFEIQRRALSSDYFLLSANAISEDGVLVNIDGMGNRVAGMVFGPKNVIVIAGMNKLAKTLEAARIRARTYASPVNALRVGAQNTPCVLTGSCGDCTSASSICTYVIETRLSKPTGRIKVILVGESLGF
jgi:L-lactate utilization protein LutB